MEIDDDMEEGKDEKGGADELLRDFQYALKCQFMERNRNLKVSWLSPNILSWHICATIMPKWLDLSTFIII